MTVQIALQNTLAQFPGLVLQHMNLSGGFWCIRIAKEDATITFEVDAHAHVACVLERKNVGYRSVAKFMNALMNELEQVDDEGEDPRPVES
jgi:hypothetical protein